MPVFFFDLSRIRAMVASGTCASCGKKIDYGWMYCKDCRPTK